jgi:hypothetical protein
MKPLTTTVGTHLAPHPSTHPRQLVFKDKKVCAGGLMIVHEDALYTHHLTLEMLKKLVEQHGGKFQAECNSATDVFMLGEGKLAAPPHPRPRMPNNATHPP